MPSFCTAVVSSEKALPGLPPKLFMLEECGNLDFPVLAGLAKLFSGLSGGLDGDSLGKLGKGDMGREVLKYKRISIKHYTTIKFVVLDAGSFFESFFY
jgi:hypothetical protein